MSFHRFLLLLKDLTGRLRRRTPHAREQFLLVNEEWEGRAELAGRLNEPLPVVPIRAGSETFAFHRGRTYALRGIGFLCLAVLAASVIYGYSDPERLLGDWPDILAAVLVLGGGGAFFLWYAEVFEHRFVVDEDAITEVYRSRRRSIRWTEVLQVRAEDWRGGMVLISKEAKIGFPESLIGYGRLANIVMSRVRNQARGK